MTEQEAREILDEIRTVRPRKRVGRTLYELQPDGHRVHVYRLTKSGKRAIYEFTTTRAAQHHPDVRAWLEAR